MEFNISEMVVFTEFHEVSIEFFTEIQEFSTVFKIDLNAVVIADCKFLNAFSEVFKRLLREELIVEKIDFIVFSVNVLTSFQTLFTQFCTPDKVVLIISNISSFTHIEYSFTYFTTDTKTWNVSDVPTITADLYIIDTSKLRIQ